MRLIVTTFLIAGTLFLGVMTLQLATIGIIALKDYLEVEKIFKENKGDK